MGSLENQTFESNSKLNCRSDRNQAVNQGQFWGKSDNMSSFSTAIRLSGISDYGSM